MNVDTVIAAYIRLRDQRDILVKEQKAVLAPFNEKMYKLQTWLQKQLQDSGQQSAKTPSGTAFLQTDTSVTVEDFEAVLQFIKQHDLWVMLEKRVSKSVVTDFIESNQAVPPGVKVTSEISCHIRRS